MFKDFISLIQWYAPIFLIGMIAFLSIFRLFDKFLDRGYAFAKIIGVVILGFVVFALSSFKLVRFSSGNIYITAFILTLLFLNPSYNNRLKEFFEVLKKNWKIIIFEEVFFIFLLAAWSFVRALAPDLNSLEKFMDFGFINTLMRTDFMPPKDIWLGGHTINYYYFGQYLTALFCKISHVNTAISYNLMIATLIALVFTMTFSLTSSLLFTRFGKVKLAAIGGMISALFISFAGNLQTVIYGVVLPYLKRFGLFHGQLQSYWYASATRYIGYFPETHDKTIHEFPAYSYIVSDLHGHVLDIPIVLVTIALIYVIIRTFEFKKIIPAGILIGLNLAIMFMTNTWDAPAILMFGLGSVGLLGLITRNENDAVLKFLTFAVLVCACFILCALPFIMKFQFFSQGLGLSKNHTPVYQFLVLWGFGILTSVVYAGMLIKRFFKKKFADRDRSSVFVLLLSLAAMILILLPEVIYIKDIYGGDYVRANTMFKFTFEAFVLFSITFGYIFVYLFAEIRKKWLKLTIIAPLGFLYLASFAFMFFAIGGYYWQSGKAHYKGLNGIEYLRKQAPDDYEVVKFLQSLPNQPTIAEAYGESYTDFDHRSAFSGLPTPIGWYVHELLWHGDSDSLMARRADLDLLYTSQDRGIVEEVIKKYQIKYIVIGTMERQKYGSGLKREILEKFGKVVYKSGEDTVVKVDNKNVNLNFLPASGKRALRKKNRVDKRGI